MKKDTVDFTPEAVKAYLDKCIRYWRSVRDNPEHAKREMGSFYVDAFQSVRVSLFGELLSPPGGHK